MSTIIRGYDAGDEALRMVSDVLCNNVSYNVLAYRVGGDEFMLLFLSGDEKFVAEQMQNLRKKMSETPYVCAFGMATKQEGAHIEDVIKLSDERMYADKAAVKKKKV